MMVQADFGKYVPEQGEDSGKADYIFPLTITLLDLLLPYKTFLELFARLD